MNAISLDLQLHLERSKCINAFVDVEKALIALTGKLCPGHDNELLSQKVNRLRDVAPGPSYSKDQRKQLHAMLGEVETLTPVRNDIVHGSLTVLHDGCSPLAAFINVRHIESFAPTARLLTADQLQRLTEALRTLAGRLDRALVRPAKAGV